MNKFSTDLLFLDPLYDVLYLCLGPDGAPCSQAVVPLLVLALLPELREDLLVKLPTLGLAVLPSLGVLGPVNLFLPLKKIKGSRVWSLISVLLA